MKPVPASDAAVRYLSLGDSITVASSYQRQIFNFTDSPGSGFAISSLGIGGTVDTVGTRSAVVGGTTYKFEGRSGTSIYGFYSSTNGGKSDGLDSLFIFPVGVTALNYRGNVNFWKKVVTGDSALGGYTILSREGSSSTVVYDANGYPTSVVDPSTREVTAIGAGQNGWIVIDPAFADGSRWRVWNGTAWIADATQSRTWEFNFTKHLARYQLSSYSTGNPTHVSMYFAYNEGLVGNKTPLDDWTTFFTDYENMVANIRAADANIKVLILTPHLTEVQSGWRSVTSQSGRYIQATIQNFTKALLDKFDTAAKRTDKTYVVPFGSGVDPQYGYGLTNAARPNKYISDATLSIRSIVDPVHPDPFGSAQGGDWVAATIQGTRNT